MDYFEQKAKDLSDALGLNPYPDDNVIIQGFFRLIYKEARGDKESKLKSK